CRLIAATIYRFCVGEVKLISKAIERPFLVRISEECGTPNANVSNRFAISVKYPLNVEWTYFAFQLGMHTHDQCGISRGFHVLCCFRQFNAQTNLCLVD